MMFIKFDSGSNNHQDNAYVNEQNCDINDDFNSVPIE